MRFQGAIAKFVLCVLACGAGFFFAARSVAAQDWAQARLAQSPRHSEWKTVSHDGRMVQAFIAYPEASGKRPVVLVIHEIFGMTDWAQEVADEFAAAGYIAVAPDLLSGMGPNGKGSSAFSQSDAIRSVSSLDPNQITADLNAAADYALKLPSAEHKLFVAGFCWGGGESFRFATNRADLAAAFVFYGPPPDRAAMARIHAPVYGFYAGNDYRIASTVPQTKSDMKALGKEYWAAIYGGARHGFMRLGESPDGTPADRTARDQAWEKAKQVLAARSKD